MARKKRFTRLRHFIEARMRHVIHTAILCLSLSTGCYTVRFGNAETAGDKTGQSYQIWTHSLFWGLVPLGRVNIDQCGDTGIKRMKSQIGGLGLVAYALTAGIWTPMHVKIACARPRGEAFLPAPQLYPVDQSDALVWAPMDAPAP